MSVPPFKAVYTNRERINNNNNNQQQIRTIYNTIIAEFDFLHLHKTYGEHRTKHAYINTITFKYRCERDNLSKKIVSYAYPKKIECNYLISLCFRRPLLIIIFSFFSGYDRKLPGFPRYTVLGSDESGEYSLKVSNATLEDDAVYECQVGPAPSNKPIRASARLNVMRKFFYQQIKGFDIEN